MNRGASRHRLGLALFGLCGGATALVLPGPAKAQCTLSSGIVQFEPNPPGAPRPALLYPGFSDSMDVYRAGGANRMLISENFGYSILDLSNPGNPTALAYHDLRAQVPVNGDGQSYIARVAVASDGSRAVISTQSPSAMNNLLMQAGNPDGSFSLAGDFLFRSSVGIAVQKLGSRYMGYALKGSLLTAADLTGFLPGNTNPNTIASEVSPFPGGSGLQLTGPYLVYRSGSNAFVVNASSPGPAVGSYTTSMPGVTIPLSAWGHAVGETLRALTGAVDPSDPSPTPALYLLGAFGSGTNSTGFTLLKLTGGTGGTPAVVGNFVPPPPYSGGSSAVGGLVWAQAATNDVILFMWARSASPASYKMYTKTASSWGAPAGEVLVDPVAFPSFGLRAMRTLAPGGTSLYAYVASSLAAYVLPLNCLSPTSPASTDLTVEPDPCPSSGPCPLADGATVFVGDKLKITPTIYTAQPLTDWRFDFDFHAGSAEDNGSSPRVRYPDLQWSGAGSTPPATISLVGPCDPKAGGADASGGSGCWLSVQNNGAYGGPDFVTPIPPAGTTRALALALEATNVNGSSPPRLFPLVWKVPAVRLQSTSLLLGNPATTVTDASEGSPLASGYSWYFGADPSAPAGETLTRDAGCSGRVCNHAFASRGTYNWFVRVPYANGYASADCASPCTQRLGTLAVADVALALAAAASVQAGHPVPVTNSSLLAPAVTPCPPGQPGWQYSLCDASAGPCSPASWTNIALAGTTLLPGPPTAGTYWLRIRYNYTTNGLCASSLTASWTPAVPGIADATAFPVTVIPVVPSIRILVNGVDPCIGGFCTPGQFDALTGDVLTAWALVDGTADPNPPLLTWSFGPGASPASCGPSAGCQGVSFTYNEPGSPVVTLSGYSSPVSMPGNILPSPVTASSNTPICSGETLILTASSLPGATYGWTGPNGFTSQQQNPSLPDASAAAGGTYTVTRTFGGNVSSAIVNVVVKQGPGTVVAGSNSPVCAGSTINLTAPAVAGATYLWTGPSGFTSAQQNPSIMNASAVHAGTYTVVVTNPATGCFSSASTGVAVAAACASGPTKFYSLTPCRVIDTRDPDGPRAGPALSAVARRDFTVTGVCGVPAAAVAISANVTVTGPTASGFLTLFPGNASLPNTSTVSFSAGQTRANNAIVLLSSDGSGIFAVQNGSGGSVHFIVDVNGFFE